jgi:small-conductance mechanosensitive channel
MIGGNWYSTLSAYLSNEYLLALALLVIFYVISQIFVLIVKHFIAGLVEKTKTDVDDKILQETKGPISLILLLLGALVALIPLTIPENIANLLSKSIVTTIIIVVTLTLIKIVNILIDGLGSVWAKRTKSTIDDALLPLAHKTSKVVVGLIGLLIILKKWDIDITGILAGVGVAGLAIGFAIKDSLANIFGGASMILDRAVKVGDVVELEDGATSGTVVDVGLRSTRIKTWDNELLIIPNGQFANSRIKNMKLPNLKARATIQFGVAYGAGHERVKRTVLKALEKVDGVLGNPEPFVRFIDMADSALLFKLYFWVENVGDRVAVREKALCTIYDALNHARINIPFPQMDVHLYRKK